MGDYIDLTLGSDDEAPGAPKYGNSKRNREPTTSNSSDVVLVVDEPDTEARSKRSRASAAAETADNDLEDEVVVTAECGDDPMRDYPHGRPECRVYRLQKGISADNCKTCANCYCYVCDKKATDCQFWGTGTGQRDHCNAHTSSYWDALRKAARQNNTALLVKEYNNTAPQLGFNSNSHTPAATAAAAPGGSSSRVNVSNRGQASLSVLWAGKARAAVQSSDALLQGNSDAAAGGSGAAAAAVLGTGSNTAAEARHWRKRSFNMCPGQPQHPPASARLERMPYPNSSKIQHIATVELPFKAVKGVTVQELQQRLASTGFYWGLNGMPLEYGDHLCLDNITKPSSCHYTDKQKCGPLRLLPLIPPGGLLSAPDSRRTWTLVVVPFGAAARPHAAAVTVQRDCKLSELCSALTEKLQRLGGSAALETTEELLFASMAPNASFPDFFKDQKRKMSDESLSSSIEGKTTFFAFKVPKDLLERSMCLRRDVESQAGCSSHADSKQRTKLVVIMHKKAIRPLADDSDGVRVTTFKQFGLPQLIEVQENHFTGGSAAESAVRKSVAAQLGLFCRPGPQPSMQEWPFELHRPAPMDVGTRFSHESHYLLSHSIDRRTFAPLYAHWDERVAPPSAFDMEAFSAAPRLTDAEDVNKTADLPKMLKAWKEYLAVTDLLRSLPHEVISELRSACAATAPSHHERQGAVGRALKPCAAAVLSIVGADSSGSSSSAATSGIAARVSAAANADAAVRGKAAKQYSSDRLGILHIEVYIYKQAGRDHTLVAEEQCDQSLMPLPVRACGRHPRYWLSAVMNARLLQEQSGYELLQEIERLKTANVLGIAKLIDWLKTGERAAAPQPPGLTVQLHPYQLQSLSFMIEAERMEGGWRQLLWRWVTPVPPEQQQQQVTPVVEHGKGVWWSPVLDRLSYTVPPAPWGGFLAEEMGLGKTVEVLGLVLSNPAPASVISGRIDSTTGKVLSRATLVVCAVSLVGQWCTEAKSKLAGNVRMYPYHGSNRVRDPFKLATNYDIVVTTYQTLGSDYGGKKGTKDPIACHRIKWHRVVFDEGHMVKNSGAAQSKAAVSIAADRRWVCSGTPVNNDIGDLFGQFAVLQMQPLSSKTYFEGHIKPAFTFDDTMNSVPLLYALRHTKAQNISGRNVLSLPEKNEELVPVTLSSAEQQAYLDVHHKAAALWAAVRHMRPADINKMLLQIMALLLPLRRICSGGSLTPSDLALPHTLELATQMHQGSTPPAAAAAAAGAGRAHGNVNIAEDSRIKPPEAVECAICLDNFEAPVMTPCHHWFCRECILGVLDANTHCPLCRSTVGALGLRAPGKNNQATPVQSSLRRPASGAVQTAQMMKRRTTMMSTSQCAQKMQLSRSSREPQQQQQWDRCLSAKASCSVCNNQALLAELVAMRQADLNSKALVFSQYNSTLEWLRQKLPERGFGFRTITGSMAQRQRAKAIMAFQEDPPTTVFLLSMRSGAVGINLTAASHVFLLEPCLNPALEAQAIGRAWRMGQTRKVTVKRFYVKGSVEERIMDVRNIRQGHAAHSAAATAAAANASTGSGSEASSSCC